MFVKYVNIKGVVKYVKSITKEDNTSVEETRFTSTQMPHQDFMNALGQVGNIFAENNFKEIKDRIVINEISFDWDEIKEETKVKTISCKYDLYSFDDETNKLKGVVGEIVIKKQLVSEELRIAIDTLITEAECFCYGKTSQPNLFEMGNVRVEVVNRESEQISASQ